MFLWCNKHKMMVKAERPDKCPLGHVWLSYNIHDDVVVIEIDYCCFDEGYSDLPPKLGNWQQYEAQLVESWLDFEEMSKDLEASDMAEGFLQEGGSNG